MNNALLEQWISLYERVRLPLVTTLIDKEHLCHFSDCCNGRWVLLSFFGGNLLGHYFSLEYYFPIVYCFLYFILMLRDELIVLSHHFLVEGFRVEFVGDQEVSWWYLVV